ncbi:hypothetical protein [Halorubrum sp. AJ67]|uniref:hypothetical protein n=1 Tax=Halorubrum sp. AJ67 TaxID=1173487 RepID=UPI0012ABAB1E|nr:hypothetical protein [Halorubrum sp. AJ67]
MSDPYLSQFSTGDMIEVSCRKTSMEVQKAEPTPDWDDRVYKVIAENRHGRYRVTENEDGEFTFYVSSSNYWGKTWSPEESGVSVSRPDE